MRSELAYCVRPMRREDVDQVTEIDREAFPTQWPPPNYRHELQNQLAHYIVAVDEAKKVAPRSNKRGLLLHLRHWFGNGKPEVESPQDYILGFCGIWLMADEAHITSIAVRADYRQRGIGELLLITTIELAMQLHARLLTLEVRISNSGAQNLYYKYGFKQAGIRRAYYTDNKEDAMIMSTDPLDSASFKAAFNGLR